MNMTTGLMFLFIAYTISSVLMVGYLIKYMLYSEIEYDFKKKKSVDMNNGSVDRIIKCLLVAIVTIINYVMLFSMYLKYIFDDLDLYSDFNVFIVLILAMISVIYKVVMIAYIVPQKRNTIMHKVNNADNYISIEKENYSLSKYLKDVKSKTKNRLALYVVLFALLLIANIYLINLGALSIVDGLSLVWILMSFMISVLIKPYIIDDILNK